MFNSPSLPLKTSSSVEEYLEKNLSDRQRKIINFLDKIQAGDAKKIYKTMLFCQSYPDMPAIELVLSHCLNEMFNSMLRREESLNKEILLNAAKEMGLPSNSDSISDILKKIKKSLSQNEEGNYDKERIRKFVEDKLSVKYGGDKVVDVFVKKLSSKKDSTHRFRHFDQELKHDLAEVESMIYDVEETFLILSSNYLYRIENVRNFLEKINAEPFQDDSDITNTVYINLTKETEEYFFQNLKNPKWLQRFQKDLNPGKLEFESWPQGIYLSKIAKEKPSEVFKIIKPYLEERLSKNIDVCHFILMRIFKIAENFPDEKDDDKNYSLKVGKAYLSYLQYDQDLVGVINSHYVKDFLNDLAKKSCAGLVLQITEKLLEIKPNPEKARFNDFRTRFNDSANMADYYYEEVLKVIKNSVLEKNSFQLFVTLCKILQNAVDGEFLKESSQRLCFNRSAIEEHEQDQYRNSAENKLITAIRDVAEYVFENDSKNKTEVIGILEKKLSDGSDFLIFTRIILHLLRKYPEKQGGMITKHLVIKERFDDDDIHHEYYLLLQQEFKNLSAKNRKKILDFINSGFRERKNHKVPENEAEQKEQDAYAERYLFNKLYCISDGLDGAWKEKYQELSSKFQKEKRPDLTHYIGSAFVLDKSPLAEEELAEKSLQEIIEFLTSWKPDGGFGSANPRGLGDILEKDFEKNSRKYLDGLLMFKKVENPTYLKRIFRALAKDHTKTEDDWKVIVELGKWTSEQLDESVNEDLNLSSFDSDAHWGWCKQEFIKVISESFRSKEPVQSQIPESLFEKIFSILEKLILDKDTILENWGVDDSGDDKHYTRAINSCHGEAIEAVIEFGLWLIRESKQNFAVKLVIPILDKLIAKNSYLEGWAVLGRYFPWIITIDENWAKKNLDNIFPENNKNKFNAAWLTYINFVPPFDNVFDMLKAKYFLALENPTDEEKDNKRSHFKFGESISAFYSRGKIDLGDVLLKKLFEKRPQDGATMIFMIGRWCCNENNPMPEEFVDRFKKLWDWRVKNSTAMPMSIKEYQSFKWWYKSGLFNRKWALEQLLESAKNLDKNVIPEIYIVGDKLLEDLQKYPETAWEVIKLVLKVEGYFIEIDMDFVKQVFEIIERSNWNEIKNEAMEVKDEYCKRNKLDKKFIIICR